MTEVDSKPSKSLIPSGGTETNLYGRFSPSPLMVLRLLSRGVKTPPPN